jgi:hypothetical protein
MSEHKATDRAGSPLIGAVPTAVKISRSHAFNCGNCPRWDRLNDNQGVCRLRFPHQVVVGVGEGLARQLLPVTHPVYDITIPSDVCAFHPELLLAELKVIARGLFQVWDTRVSWDREKGFNRAPSLAEAQQYAAQPEKDEKTS